MFLFWKKANTFHKYCPAAIWLTAGTKLVYKVENSTFWKMTNIAICLISAAVSITFNSKTPDNCPRGKLPPGYLPTGWLPAGWLPQPPDNCPHTIFPEENCLQGKVSPRQLPPHHKIPLENNCPHSSKLPSESTTSELKKTVHCLRVHGIIVKQKNITHIT